jgi:hypothetical protein
MKFRTPTYPQPDLLADQQILEQALKAGGPDSVAAAMAMLKGEPLPAQDSFGVDAVPVEDDWEWALTEWTEPLIGAQTYDLRTKRIGGDEAAMMLRGDAFFNRCLLSAVISPTHLTTTGCAVSMEPGALNCQAALCPNIVKWLMASRKGGWECAGISDGSCSLQHYCKGGRDCDEDGCELLHPEEGCRWVVLESKTQEWAMAMTLDEAIHYSDGGKSEMKALTMGVQDCTHADALRASAATLAFGRRKTPVAAAVPAPAEQNAAPAHAAVAPAAAPAKPAPSTEAPAETAIVPADDAGATTAAQTEALAKGGLASTDGLGTKKTGQPALGPPSNKRAKLLHDARGWPAASARCIEDDEKCFHFIELTQAYLTDGMSEEYQKVLRRAARLTPAERAALLTRLASMIQEDQTTSLKLLDHSIIVTEHFAKKASK